MTTISMTTTILRGLVATGLAIGSAAGSAACADSPIRVSPINRVVVLIDTSGTYAKRVPIAIEKVSALLGTMATPELRRWDPAADRISIVTIDALPDVIWEGTLRDLEALDAAAWQERVTGRRDLSGCTDLAAAFRLAAARLTIDDGFPTAGSYAWAFTDLIDEPPTTSVRACRPPSRPSLPPREFPWDALAGTAVEVFWVPADQKLAWRRAAESQGLTTWVIHAEDESASVRIAAPARPVQQVNESDQRQATAALKSALRTAGVWLVAVAVLCALALWGLVAGARAIARRRRGPAGGGPVAGSRPALTAVSRRVNR